MMILRSHDGEEGASATVFLLSLFALLGIAMLAIDGGSLFVSRRGQIADTDSAALAAAQALLEDPCMAQADVNNEADGYIDLNDTSTDRVGDATVDYLVPGDCRSGGVVTVITERSAALFFAPIFGFDQVDTGVRSGVIYGQLEELEGLRPMGTCVNDPHYALEWQPYWSSLHGGPPFSWAVGTAAAEAGYLALYPPAEYPEYYVPDWSWHPTEDKTGTSYPGDAHVHRIVFFEPSSGDSCGGNPRGNFGWMDFDGNGAGTDVPHDCEPGVSPRNELNCDLNTGFDGVVSITPPDCRTNDGTVDRCESEPGAVSSASSGLETLRCDASLDATDPSCETIYIVVYNSNITPAGGASDAQFELESVAGLVIRDFKATGPPKTHYIDIEFVDQLAMGAIGPIDTSSTAPLGVALCKTNQLDNC